jgi:threonine dehydrogenase-like Zn-dependent dehydrogenase
LYWLCDVHDIYGFHHRTQGGWASYMKFPSGAINHVVPSSLDPHTAVFIEPLSCSVHGVDRGNIQFGDTVVVSGCGPIGLGMVAAAKNKNPQRIIAIDLHQSRLDLARECGADVVLNPTKDNVVKTIREISNGYGCDGILLSHFHD